MTDTDDVDPDELNGPQERDPVVVEEVGSGLTLIWVDTDEWR